MYLFFVTYYLIFSSFQKPQFDYIGNVGRLGPVFQNGLFPSYQPQLGPMFQSKISSDQQNGMNTVDSYLQRNDYNSENIHKPQTAGRHYNSKIIYFGTYSDTSNRANGPKIKVSIYLLLHHFQM